MKVGYIGLGLMGNPMSKNLVKNGHEVTVWNRTASRMQDLVEAGAKASKSAAEVASNSEFIFINVSDSSDVEEVVLGKDGIMEGAAADSVVIDNSTISPDVTKLIASKLSEKGIHMLDAPVSGGDVGAAAGTLSVMVGGEREIFDRCLSVLESIGTSITYCGEIGLGQVTKLSNQILGLGNMAAVCEAIVFATKAGVDPEALINAWSGGAANSWMMSNLGPKIFKRDFAPGFMVDLAQKDLRLVLESASEMDVPLLTTPIVNQIYRSVQQDGNGTDGIQAYVKTIEKLAGIEVGS